MLAAVGDGENPMQSDHGADPSPPAAQEQRRHYCRGCGLALPLGFRGHFHKECLRVDKRSRICEQRRREQERFSHWLEKQRCRNCGATYGDQRSDGGTEALCEASRRTQDRDPPVG